MKFSVTHENADGDWSLPVDVEADSGREAAIAYAVGGNAPGDQVKLSVRGVDAPFNRAVELHREWVVVEYD
jgi:hypothetical protein